MAGLSYRKRIRVGSVGTVHSEAGVAGRHNLATKPRGQSCPRNHLNVRLSSLRSAFSEHDISSPYCSWHGPPRSCYNFAARLGVVTIGVSFGVTQLLEISYRNFVMLTVTLIRLPTNPGKNLCDQHEQAGNMKK